MDPEILVHMYRMMRQAGYSMKAGQRMVDHLGQFDNMEQVKEYNKRLKKRLDKLHSLEGRPEAQMKYMEEQSPYGGALRKQIRDEFRGREE